MYITQTILPPATARSLLRVLIEKLSQPPVAYSQKERAQTLESIIHQHGQLIMRLCYGYARSAAELSDLYQDTLINIWQGLERFRGESTERTWVYRVTFNTCVSCLRKRSRTKEQVSLRDCLELPEEASPQEASEIERLHTAIGALSPLDKAIVMMRLDEYSYEEIAETVGMNRNAVASRLRRAKEKLKDIMNQND